MNTNLKYILPTILILFITFQNAFAQPPHGGGGHGGNRANMPKIGVVKGRILDQDSKEPVEYAAVAIMRMRDSTVVGGGITDEKGNFKVEELPFGRFYLIAKFIGYDRYKTEPFGINPKSGTEVDLGQINLKASDDAIEAVEVVVEKPLVMTSIDKKVFNAEKNITAAGGTAVDVLNNVPSVAVDQDGVVSLRGNSNVTVLIDGKPSGLTGGGRQALLEQIPASNIQDIEVITNPSAKYDPDGLSGIINIKLKKNRLKGTNGYVSVTLGNDGHPHNGNSYINKYNANTQLSYKNKKMNVYANYSYNNKASGMVNGVNQDVFVGTDINTLDQGDLGTRARSAHMVKGGADFYLNKKNTFSLSSTVNFNTHDHGREILYQSLFNEVLFSETNRTAVEETKGNSTDLSGSYKRTFDKDGRELTAEFNYSDGGRTEYSDYDQFYGITQNESELYIQQNTIQNRTNQIITGQMDYVNPLSKKFKIETGWKVIARNINNDFYSESYDTVSESIYPDSFLINDFNYEEQIYAGYGMGMYEFNKKWSFQGGLRAEQAFTTSNLVTTGQIYDTSYFAMYPSAYLQYKIKDSARESSSIVLSYSRRINRPRTRILNPFADLSNPNSIRRGNPFLRPEFTNSYEFTYSIFKKGISLNTSAYYKFTKNMITRASFLSNQVQYTTWSNVGNATSYGLEASLSGKLLPFMRIVLSGNGNWNVTRGQVINAEIGDTVNLDNDAFGLRSNLILNFKIKKKFDLQLSSWYRAPRNTAQGQIYSMKSVDLALKRTFKKKLDVSIRLSDLLNTQYFSMQLNDTDAAGNGYITERLHDWESQNVYATIAYRFGQQTRSRGGRRGRKKGKGNEGGFDGGGSDGGM